MPKTESPTITKQFADFSAGMNRTASRTRIKDSEMFTLENAQPIGPGEIQTLAPRGPDLATIAPGIAKMYGRTIRLGGVEAGRLITLNRDGSMSAIDPVTGGVTVIGPAGTFTVNAVVEMWEDTPLLIGDPVKGYFSWDGTTLLHYPLTFTGNTHTNTTLDTIVPNTTGLTAGMAISGPGIPVGTTIVSVDSAVKVTLSAAATATAGITFKVGNGAPSSVRSLAVFEGRVWLVTALRTITYSAPASYTDFAVIDAAGSAQITDSVFAGAITRLLSALELLWIVGPSAENAISNVQVGGTPVLTTFSNTNIVADVGSVLPDSVATYLRTFLFRAPYGVYAIVGATPQKLSDNLDGLFRQIDSGPGEQSPAGTFALNQVFVWAVFVHYLDPVLGRRPVLLCFARNAWFMASQGDDLTWITPLVEPDTGQRHLWGTNGLQVFKCFSGEGPGFYEIRTKLWDFGAFTSRKQLLRIAAEMQSDDLIDATFTVENESGAQAVDVDIEAQNEIIFVGSGPITFVGSGPIRWVTSGTSLASSAQINFGGNYLGMKVAGVSKPFVFSAFAWELGPFGEWTIGRQG